MISDLNDTEMLAKISGGDFVAMELKYHFTCLSNYRNRHQAFMRSQEKVASSDLQRAKARSMVELLSFVKASIEHGTNLFYAKIFVIYLGIQEQSDGHKTVYAFPKGLEEVLKSAMGEHNYEEEALLFAKVAKIIR
eukprot:gene19363-21283_t